MTTFLIIWFSIAISFYLVFTIVALCEKKKWYYYINRLYRHKNFLETAMLVIASILNITTVLFLVFMLKKD